MNFIKFYFHLKLSICHRANSQLLINYALLINLDIDWILLTSTKGDRSLADGEDGQDDVRRILSRHQDVEPCAQRWVLGGTEEGWRERNAPIRRQTRIY